MIIRFNYYLSAKWSYLHTNILITSLFQNCLCVEHERIVPDKPPSQFLLGEFIQRATSMGVGSFVFIYKIILLMTTTSLIIILTLYAVLIAFFVYMEFKLKDRDSHFELVEIVPLKGKNVITALKELGVTDINIQAPTEYSFTFKGES